MRSRALDWRQRRYVALDFETTGLDPAVDGVVSFGLVPVVSGRIELAGALSETVDPGVVPTPESIKIHQIRPSEVRAAERLAVARERLAAGLGDDLVVVWTAWVETAFLAKTLGGSPRSWRKRIIDVRHLVVCLDETTGKRPSPARAGDLGTTASRFGIPPEASHDALADAFVTAQLFLAAAGRLSERAHLSVRDLRRTGR
jgi:DNA polymerase-3 subunit epsilon